MDKSLAIIVGNDRTTADTIRNALESRSFQTESVQNEREILGSISRRLPWLVVLDLDLHGLAGNLILERMRNDDRLRQIKVIAVTAHAQAAESLSVEPDLLLFKPVEAGQFSDLLERFQLKLKYQTTIPMIGEPWDRVTGVYNQVFFSRLLERSLLQASETNHYLFAVLSVSLDQDGQVRGHLEIKNWLSVLRVAADTLATTVRPSDTVARFDQDNFYILIDNIPDHETPRMVAARARKNLVEKLTCLGYKVSFRVNVGVLLCDGRYKDIEDILNDAISARSLGTSQDGTPVFDQKRILLTL